MIWIMLIYEYIYQNDGFHTVYNASIAAAYSVIKICSWYLQFCMCEISYPFNPPPLAHPITCAQSGPNSVRQWQYIKI